MTQWTQFLKTINYPTKDDDLLLGELAKPPVFKAEQHDLALTVRFPVLINAHHYDDIIKAAKVALDIDLILKFEFKLPVTNWQLLKPYVEIFKMHNQTLASAHFFQLTDDQLIVKTPNVLTILLEGESEANLCQSVLSAVLTYLNQCGFPELKLTINYKNQINLKAIHEAVRTAAKTELATKTKQQPTSTVSVARPMVKSTRTASYKELEIKDIVGAEPHLKINGQVIKTNLIKTRNNSYIISWLVTDFTSSIFAILFIRTETMKQTALTVKEGDWLQLTGDVRYDNFRKDDVFYIKTFKVIKPPTKRTDESKTKRVELKLHTKMTAMDGVNSVTDYFALAAQLGHQALAVTDINSLQSFPEMQQAYKKYPQVKPIYGLSLTTVDDVYPVVFNNQHHLDLNLKTARYVVFDLETTGLSAEYDEIIEFGAVLIENMTIVDRVDFLIKPEGELSAKTQELTGLSAAMLADKPTMAEVMPEILAYIKDAVLIAHNATFDFDFLNAASKKYCRYQLANPVIDTLPLARILVPELTYYRLGTVARKLNINYDEAIAHRGDYDAQVLADVYFQLLRRLDQSQVESLQALASLATKNISASLKVKGYDVTCLAKDQAGLKALFKLTSLSHTKYFLNGPKMLKSVLNKYREHLLIGSGAQNGKIFEIALNKPTPILLAAMADYDYIEVQPPACFTHLIASKELTHERLEQVITRIITAAQKLNKPVVATGDVYYLGSNEKIYRDIYITAKRIGGKHHPLFDRRQPTRVNPDQGYLTTAEMSAAFTFLNDQKLIKTIVITNPLALAKQIKVVYPIKDRLYPPVIDEAEAKLTTLCYQTAKAIYGDPLPTIVENRLQQELAAINKHGYAVIYWIAHRLVKASLANDYLVGSRGSVGSSFVATMANITEVNPLPPHYRCPNCGYSEFCGDDSLHRCGFDLPKKACSKCQSELIGDGHNIPFETFLGFKGEKVPDIDLNFSGDYQMQAHNQTREMFGEKHVFRAGTISTVATKTAFSYVHNYLELTGQDQTIRKAELERLAFGCEGVKRTTGQHPGGLVIIPQEYEVEDFTSVNYPADDTHANWLTTHFDFHAIHDNLLKLDLLGHVDPTALKMLADLTNIRPETISTNDPKVLSLFSSLAEFKIKPESILGETTGAIGIPEFGTGFVRQMLQETKPQSFAELVQISGLSHGTDVWLNNAQLLIKEKHFALKDVVSCRDDIMLYLLKQKVEATVAFAIMEDVRKGRGLKPAYRAIMKKHHVPDWYIETCEKIKYMFPKAHATAYVLMAWRVMWYKLYYPEAYYATFFSTRCDVFDLKVMSQGQTAIQDRLNRIKTSLNSPVLKYKVSQKEKDLVPVLEVALEMNARGIEFANLSLEQSAAAKFTIITVDGKKKILPPFIAIDNLGAAAATSVINARNQAPIISIEDLQTRTILTKTNIADLEALNVLEHLSNKNQISLDLF